MNSMGMMGMDQNSMQMGGDMNSMGGNAMGNNMGMAGDMNSMGMASMGNTGGVPDQQ